MIFFSKFTKSFLLLLLLSSNSIMNSLKAETYYDSTALCFTLFLGLGFGMARLEDKIRIFEKFFSNKLIDAWIANNNLNNFGDSKDTQYEACPLAENETHYDFIKNKFPKAPWLKNYKPVIKTVKSLQSTIGNIFCGGMIMSLLGYFFMFASDTGYKSIAFDTYIKEMRYKIDHTPTYDLGYVG